MKLTRILKRLLETFDYSELTDYEISTLNYLIHDKAQVTNSIGRTVPAIEKALRLYSEKAPDLFRGVYPEEKGFLLTYKDIESGKAFSMDRYTSFSEKKEFALLFTTATNIMISVKNATGFCYWKYFVSSLEKLRNEDPQSFDAEDGDYLIGAAEEESEWILPMNAKYKLLNIKKEGELTIYECEMV